MAYTAWSVVYGEQPTAAKWNQLGANDAGFKDGTNIDNDAIIKRHLADSTVGINEMEATATRLGFAEDHKTSSNVIPNAWTTYLTVSATSRGKAVEISAIANLRDGNSGAARTGQVRIQCDGVDVPNSARIWRTPSSGELCYAITTGNHTPSAGAHTWTFQILADTGSASLFLDATMSVKEVR